MQKEMVFLEALCPSKQRENEHAVNGFLQISLLILSDFKRIN